MDYTSYHPDDEIDGSDANASDLNNSLSFESLTKGTPKVGMVFSSDEEAYDFYNAFAKNRGFGVRKGASAKGDSGVVIRRIFVCHREGFKYAKHKRKDGKEFKPRKSERAGCCARLHVHKQDDGLWKVKYFIDRHNHPMITSPSELAKLKSHSKERASGVIEPIVIPLEIARPLSVRIGDDFRFGIEHFGSKSEGNLTNECRSMLQHIVGRQATEYGFSYSTRVDQDGKLRSIFWADHNSRLAYMKFNDLLVFDVAYNTNNFVLPFVSFTGINHHKKPTLFGCALIGDEQEETFVWLFEAFISCMGDKMPGAMITKQDPVVCKAVKTALPDTRHRFCMHQIHLLEDRFLHALRYSYNPSFDEDYNKFVGTSQTIEESEKCWLLLKEKYMVNFEARVCRKQMNELKAWDWLESMYELRHNWIESYLKDAFFAGIKSIENSYFDGFVDSMTPVHEFIVRFHKATSFHRAMEEKDDLISLSKLDYQEMNPLEAFAAKVYTRSVFDIFQLEFKSMFFCQIAEVGMRDGYVTYKVVNDMNEVKTHLVKCRVSDNFCLCACSKFETEGIPCRHMLYIMKQKLNLQHIPERYILGRWTLNASLRLCDQMNINTVVDRQKVTPFECSLFQGKLNMVFEKAKEDRECYKLAVSLVEEFWKRVDQIQK